MSNVVIAIKLILSKLASLETPTVATAVAGVLAPVIFGLFGDNFSPAVIGGWLTVVGSVSAILQQIVSGNVAAFRVAHAPAPEPVKPPVKPAAKKRSHK